MSKTKEWFDALEKALEAETKIAGLLEHGTLIGNAREFLVQRILKSVLPPLIHIGSGKVIDATTERCSKQIDVILFDARCPFLEIAPGLGMYPIEGVVGTIEVKSRLTKKTLQEALENVYSVLSLQQRYVPGSDEPRVIAAVQNRYRIDEAEARRKLRYEHLPASYVFSIASSMSAESICKFVMKWFESGNEGGTGEGLAHRSCLNGFCAALPRVIVAGTKVGILDDGSFRVTRLENTNSDDDGGWGNLSPGSMTFWKTPHRFGLLASHLWHSTAARLGLTSHATGIEFTIDRYLPLDAYANEVEQENKHQFTWR